MIINPEHMQLKHDNESKTYLQFYTDVDWLMRFWDETDIDTSRSARVSADR